ncbi:MAG: nucleotide sugar dehydrogenase [Polyangiaceae bacterium]
MTDLEKNLAARIASREAKVGIVGMGYVGLPLALAFCDQGFSVLGFDVDRAKVEKLEKGENYIQHLHGDHIEKVVKEGKLHATTDFSRLAEMDAILVAVPTPLTRQREPEMRYIVMTSEAIAKTLRKGQLVVLESTTYPGTTDELVRAILEKGSGLTFGQDFFLAFSPEREDPGNPSFETRTIPKVVGGVDEASGRLAETLYQAAVAKVVRVGSARAAEATKLTENIFRAVNIALVNELKVVYDRMGIDVWDVLDAAETKPFGFMRFNPGPGLGGHCIPLDPFYLTWKAREYGLATRFIELAGEVNLAMPRYVVDKLQGALNDAGKPLKGAKVLLLGLAYKKNVGDPRESPSFELMDLMIERGAEVDYHDPHIPESPHMRRWAHLAGRKSVPLEAAVIAGYDAVVISTDHAAVDYDLLREHAKIVVDTRGVYREGGPNIVKA